VAVYDDYKAFTEGNAHVVPWEKLKGVLDTIAEVWGFIYDKSKIAIEYLIEHVPGWVKSTKDVVDSVVATVGDAVDAIAGSDVVDSVVSTGRDVVDSVVSTFGGAVGSPEAAGHPQPGDKAGAVRWFMGMGWSKANAIGIVQSLFDESGLKPRALNPKSGAYGIAQWLGDRKTRLFGTYEDPGNYENQLAFVNKELHEATYRHVSRRLNEFKGDAYRSGYYFRYYYEVPSLDPLERNQAAMDSGNKALALSQKIDIHINGNADKDAVCRGIEQGNEPLVRQLGCGLAQ